MRKSLLMITVGAAALTLSSFQTVLAQTEADQQLGNVHFATSCNETAQRRFDRAMRYQHSFWYRAAREVFNEAAAADPECAIAHWGVALTYLDNPHGPIPGPALRPFRRRKKSGQRASASSTRSTPFNPCTKT